MAGMLRALALATLFLVTPWAGAVQETSVLHIKVVLADADGKAMPIPRHVLLVSDNPTSALPRRVTTAPDGTAEIKLRPGNYTVESDRPVAFQGKAYSWTQSLDIVAGRDAVLELTAANAELGAAAAGMDAATATIEADPSSILLQWQNSVVTIWTPLTHASGFVIDAKGLIATSQRAIGKATAVEVQLTPAIKVSARILVADAARDVAILWIDPNVVASVQPIPMACGQPALPVASGQEIVAIGTRLRGPTDLTIGVVTRVERDEIVTDLPLRAGGAGGPVFDDGHFVGIAAAQDDRDDGSRRPARVVRRETACEAVATVANKMTAAATPDGTHLPVEPARPFPADALGDAARRRGGSLTAYQVSSPDFDVTFLTPVMTSQPRTAMDFGNWSDYVADVPPVLLVRVTPKFGESLWTTIARGAARTQGVSVPPIKRFKTGFGRMRASCGTAEVTPIHPFTIEQRVSESGVIREGLYVFDPAALGPGCATVKLVLYSEKAPQKGITVIVDPKVLERVWQDFEPYRGLDTGPGL